jgi:hypothetical protein
MLEAFEFLGSDKAFEIVVTNTNKIASMVEILEVIIETGGVPFSPRVKGEDGEYLDCPRVVTDLVYEKASSWYGDPLPYNIEERIAKELYGDAVLNSIKYNLKDSGLSDKDMEVESFKQLHEVILKGIDAVKDLVRENVRVTSEEPLEGDALEKKLEHNLERELDKNRDIICQLLEQEIVTAYYHQKGRIANMLRTDTQVRKAKELLLDKKRYQEIIQPK